jgi:hypothetical protein
VIMNKYFKIYSPPISPLNNLNNKLSNGFSREYDYDKKETEVEVSAEFQDRKAEVSVEFQDRKAEVSVEFQDRKAEVSVEFQYRNVGAGSDAGTEEIAVDTVLDAEPSLFDDSISLIDH